MKTRNTRRSHALPAFLAVFGTLLAPAVQAQNPSPIPLTFVNNSGVQNVYITFNNTTSEPAFSVSYFDTSLNQTVALTRNGSGFSNSILLSNVQNGVFNVQNIQSGGVYVSYGTALNGSAPAPLNTGDALYGTQWFQIETTIFSPGDAANNGDFTAVNLFSGSVDISNYNGSSVTDTVGFGGTASQTLFDSLNSALTASGELGTNTSIAGLVQQSVIKSGSNYVRVMSPSNWGQSYPITGGGNGYWVGPYHSFANYVTHLLTSNGGNPQTTNLQYTFQTTSTAFNGNTYPGGLRYVCDFTATPVTATVASQTGPTFSVTGSIEVYSLPNVTLLGTVSNLTVSLPVDSAENKELSYLIYAQPGNFTTNTVFNANNWTTGGINSADALLAQQFILGDLQEGMLCGFVGSTVTLSASNCNNASYYGQMVKDVPSAVWWANYTGSMYATLQPGSPATSPYYSTYSSVIFPAGNTYSAPYDDRFKATHNPDIPINTKWVVTLNPVTASASPTPAPYAAPKLKLKRKNLRVTGETAKVQIEFLATVGSDPLKQVEFHYTGKSGQRKIALPANGKKTITIGDLKLGRMITFTAQAIDDKNGKSPVAKLKFRTPQ